MSTIAEAYLIADGSIVAGRVATSKSTPAAMQNGHNLQIVAKSFVFVSVFNHKPLILPLTSINAIAFTLVLHLFFAF